MIDFSDIGELDRWLDALDYETFWEAIAPYPVLLAERYVYDREIARGTASVDNTLIVLKRRARTDLIEAFGLTWQLQETSAALH